MRLTHDQRRAMSALLTHERNVPNNGHAALTLAALVDPQDVTDSVVSVDAQSGVMRALLLTDHSLVYGEFPLESGGFSRQLDTYEPTVWVRPRSALTGVRVEKVQLFGDQEGVEVAPSYVLQFATAEDLEIPWDSDWKSADDASHLLSKILHFT